VKTAGALEPVRLMRTRARANYWRIIARRVARIVSLPPPRCPALTALIRKTAVRHDPCRNKFRRAVRDDFRRPGSSRCTLSTGNGAAFIELWSQERALKFTRGNVSFESLMIAFDRRMTDREDESPRAARRFRDPLRARELASGIS
jgi:hypothetical protein